MKSLTKTFLLAKPLFRKVPRGANWKRELRIEFFKPNKPPFAMRGTRQHTLKESGFVTSNNPRNETDDPKNTKDTESVNSGSEKRKRGSRVSFLNSTNNSTSIQAKPSVSDDERAKRLKDEKTPSPPKKAHSLYPLLTCDTCRKHDKRLRRRK